MAVTYFGTFWRPLWNSTSSILSFRILSQELYDFERHPPLQLCSRKTTGQRDMLQAIPKAGYEPSARYRRLVVLRDVWSPAQERDKIRSRQTLTFLWLETGESEVKVGRRRRWRPKENKAGCRISYTWYHKKSRSGSWVSETTVQHWEGIHRRRSAPSVVSHLGTRYVIPVVGPVADGGQNSKPTPWELGRTTAVLLCIHRYGEVGGVGIISFTGETGPERSVAYLVKSTYISGDFDAPSWVAERRGVGGLNTSYL